MLSFCSYIQGGGGWGGGAVWKHSHRWTGSLLTANTVLFSFKNGAAQLFERGWREIHYFTQVWEKWLRLGGKHCSFSNWHLYLLLVNQTFYGGTLLPDVVFHPYFKRHWVTLSSHRCYWSVRYGPGMIHDSPVFPCAENLISSSCFGVEWPFYKCSVKLKFNLFPSQLLSLCCRAPTTDLIPSSSVFADQRSAFLW